MRSQDVPFGRLWNTKWAFWAAVNVNLPAVWQTNTQWTSWRDLWLVNIWRKRNLGRTQKILRNFMITYIDVLRYTARAPKPTIHQQGTNCVSKSYMCPSKHTKQADLVLAGLTDKRQFWRKAENGPKFRFFHKNSRTPLKDLEKEYFFLCTIWSSRG